MKTRLVAVDGDVLMMCGMCVEPQPVTECKMQLSIVEKTPVCASLAPQADHFWMTERLTDAGTVYLWNQGSIRDLWVKFDGFYHGWQDFNPWSETFISLYTKGEGIDPNIYSFITIELRSAVPLSVDSWALLHTNFLTIHRMQRIAHVCDWSARFISPE